MVQAGNPLLDAYKTPHQTVPFDLIKIEHYEPAFEAGMKAQNEEIESIVNNKEKPSFKNTIEALEYSGELLTKVSAVFFNLLSAESSNEMMEISKRIQPKLTEHGNNINLNAKLFERVKAVYQQKGNLKLNGEQMRLLNNTYDSFVNRGANLSDADKQKYRELSSKLSMLTLNFGQNVLKATNQYELNITDPARLSGLPQSFLDEAAQKAKSKGKEGWNFDLTAPSYIPVLKNADDRELRREIYMASSTKCIGGEYDNMENIRNIMNTRLEIANLLGYKTYADQVLRKRMAANSTNVYNLLNELLNGFKGAADSEFTEVQNLAKTDLKGKGSEELAPYDWNYYSEKLKEVKFDLNDEEIRPYFELENVKKGVFNLATELYGITFKKNLGIPVYHSEVEAFDVFDKDGEFLSVLYTDFHPRAGKRPGAWMTQFRGQKIENGKNIRPHVTIVMNFTRATETTPALLTFNEVETFLHEFGHALHGMFADTEYASMSGTSVYRDFVELPSQLMENFLLEKAYLDQFAVHYKTGEKIPATLVQKIVDASNFNTGYMCLRQLAFGFLDMSYHTIDKPYHGDISDFEYKATAPTDVVKRIPGTSISPAFSHIFSGGYAAGYYSYKWSEVLDADAYSLFQEKGIFNQEVADSFRKNILSKGGTEDPMELYKAFRGKAPSTDALLIRSGIIKYPKN